jgi:hypothetical protein
MKTIKILSLIITLMLSAAVVKAQNNIGLITKNYYGVKNALAAGNGADAQANARLLFADFSDQPAKGLTPDQQKVLDTYLDKLKFDSRHISETTTVDHQREHFASLSKNWYEVLKNLKLNSSIVYMQYCPMKKTYWLSESSTIKNPYYNDKMMSTCGKTTATLAAAK